jgi:hypothetical protein
LKNKGIGIMEQTEESWLKSHWRPLMGYLYMIICFVDFVLFPATSMVMPVFYKLIASLSMDYTAWVSLTLQNGGMVHLAFGAILGIAAWTRGQEKISKIDADK